MSQASIALPTHFLSKLVILHVKVHCALFRPLSFILLREVCSYLGFTPSLATIENYQIYSFDMNSTHWKPIGKFPRILGNGGIAVMISSSQVFICGGRGDNTYTGCQPCWILDAQREVEVQSMRQHRFEHALEYDEVTMGVYAFGGFPNKGTALRSAEAFSLIRGEWRKLPSMQIVSGEVRSCKSKSSVYLLGCSCTVEMFSTVSGSFSAVSIPLPPFTPRNLCVYNGNLCFMSNERLLQVKEGRLEQVIFSQPVTASCPVVLEGKWAYFLLTGGVLKGHFVGWRVDLETAEVENISR